MRRPVRMKTRAATIDEYLATLSGAKHATLQKLRKAIRSAVPRAEECISYQLPAFRLDGKMLVWFGASAHHCSFYPGAEPIRAHRRDLEGYETSKGTVRFPVDRPLSAALVRKLVKARIAERTGPKRRSAHRVSARARKVQSTDV